jgi:nicotinate-nucleotide pyrophosphorylase (carboxylating)
MDILDPKEYEHIIDAALAEDAPAGDVTTLHLFDENEKGSAKLIAKQAGVIAGLDIARYVFRKIDSDFEFEMHTSDGAEVRAGEIMATLSGKIRALLTGERVALNILQRVSGIATLTAKFVAAVKGLPVTILDTRKTAPGLRVLDKYGVRAGGARNHRLTLSDLAMIKDNHIKLAGGITTAVKRLRQRCPGIRIEVETESIEDVLEAIASGADIIMLDNMTIAMMREAVRLIGGKCQTEASGNVNIGNVREIADTGINFISIGALTHSVTALDISLKIN